MKAFLICMLAGIIAAALVYLICCFGAWSFDAGAWSQEGRVTTAILMIGAFIFAAITVETNE